MNRLLRKIKKGNCEVLNVVEQAAIDKRIIECTGGLVYAAAKYIKEKYGYNYKKLPFYVYSCCKCYPKDCTYHNCENECKCDYLPRKCIKLDNDYNDCCRKIKYIKRHKFYIKWL